MSCAVMTESASCQDSSTPQLRSDNVGVNSSSAKAKDRD